MTTEVLVVVARTYNKNNYTTVQNQRERMLVSVFYILSQDHARCVQQALLSLLYGHDRMQLSHTTAIKWKSRVDVFPKFIRFSIYIYRYCFERPAFTRTYRTTVKLVDACEHALLDLVVRYAAWPVFHGIISTKVSVRVLLFEREQAIYELCRSVRVYEHFKLVSFVTLGFNVSRQWCVAASAYSVHLCVHSKQIH